MKVVICENEAEHREFLQSVIFQYAISNEPSIEVALSAAKPDEVLAYLRDQRADCYFLDIELGSSMDGMDLACKIREHDPFADIIFISMHADRLKLTFKYKLAALDFIVKDDGHDQLAEQINEALQASFTKYQQLGHSDGTKCIQIKIGERIKNIDLDDIYYFETSPQVEHKVVLHTTNGYYEFYGKLKEFENIHERFYRCHKSYIVHLQYVKDIDKERRKIIMANGNECYVSLRKMKILEAKMAKIPVADTIIGQC
ncbi:LytTR family DNA-binding domain-containing protein [Lederbergia sp. NSJ-179]|uniref:LytR/AlgR family response regulator transcription factor n=1 Tax=Lederbergia sp. NSJ-179 TaxID=2931402 RepID=UPI001FD01D38|nr:LytTR family DNA-binding domain-containing protein [Lederbergia sp. NSJ-179]MCJ7839339.1 LytTR family DNA-binding domain-containing protein [Lederbergia sp. NSJ-179]